MTEETAHDICETLRRNGCTSVHIGGGEPFLRADELAAVVRVIRRQGMALEYVETNAGWLTDDEERNREALRKVMEAGASCFMVSADPFHIGFIPLRKPLALLRLLREENASFFVWKDKYLRELALLDHRKTYTPEELTEALGYDAVLACAREYGLGFNGRALKLLKLFGKPRPMEDFLSDEPCTALSDTSHFHVDFLGRYVPPRCTGMGILLADLDRPLDPERYPVMHQLMTGGIAALAEYARAHRYTPERGGYWSRCALCFSMRKYLLQVSDCPDLTPRAFYEQDY